MVQSRMNSILCCSFPFDTHCSSISSSSSSRNERRMKTSTIWNILMGNDGANQGVLLPLASIASSWRRLPREVISSLAASPAEVKARLAGVPIYAVVNQKREFILVGGDDESGRQMSLLFFNKDDAEGFQRTIRKENPKLGKSAQVLSTSLEAVYELALGKGSDEVFFRFMPDGRQVAHALELYTMAGIPKDGFVGVPLFQAEGLTVRGDASRYTPLFFSKDDLDMALKQTFPQTGAAAAELDMVQNKIDRARKDLANGGGDAVKKRLAEYEARLVDLKKNSKTTSNTPPPRVDVGSFEDVLVKMQEDSKGEWSDVIFVPSGSLSA